MRTGGSLPAEQLRLSCETLECMLYEHGLRQIDWVAQHACLWTWTVQERFFRWLKENYGENYRMGLDRKTNRVTVESSRGLLVMRGAIVASVASLPTTLMWGWCPRFNEETVAHPIALAMKEYGEKQGFDEFATEEVEYRSETGPFGVVSKLAEDVACCVSDLFGPDYRFYMPSMNVFGNRVTIAIWGIPREALSVDFLEAMARVRQMLRNVADPAWSLDGFARLMGAQLVEVGLDWWRLTKDDEAVELAVKRNRSGSICDVAMRRLSAGVAKNPEIDPGGFPW